MFFGKKKDKVVNQNDDKIKVDTSTITTMVGADTVIEGCLKTKSSVRILGTVIGDVRACGVVILTKTGHIIGTIEAESIIVAGVIEGNMSIRDKVNVEASGEIYGEIITKKFVIDEESIFQGNCIMNRDGKTIPVTPYKKESEEESQEAKEDLEDKKESKKEDKREDKETDNKKSDEKLKDKEDNDEKSENDSADEKESNKDESEDTVESEDSDASDKKKDSDGESEESDDDDEVNDDDDKDNEIIIADINDIEEAEDLPASGEVKSKNYVKKSKSLSVEIENE